LLATVAAWLRSRYVSTVETDGGGEGAAPAAL
jgi:hypothetical protein